MLARKEILKVKPYKPGKPIEEVKRELGLKEAIKLASNENALSPSSRVISSIEKMLKSINRYPDERCFYLKKALKSKHKLSSENIVIGNGSDEVIVLALRAFANPGDEVVTAKPTFLIYEIASTIAGVKVKTVPLKDYRYDLNSIAGALTKNTKLVFIANPDNPTGTYVTAREVDAFMRKVGKDTIVFFDEAYFEFAEGLNDYPCTLNYLNKKNVIISRTFSKIYALAGLRIGYGLANKDIISAMDRVREPFNVNSVAQVAALAAIKDRAYVQAAKRLVKEGKEYIYKNITEMAYDYIPSATNFVLINVGGCSKTLYQKLLKKGVIVRDMSAWGLSGFIRVTIGTMKENIKFIKALKTVNKGG